MLFGLGSGSNGLQDCTGCGRFAVDFAVHGQESGSLAPSECASNSSQTEKETEMWEETHHGSYVYFCMPPFIYPSIYPSILSTYLFIYLSIYLSIHPSIYPSIHLSVCLCLSLSVYPSFYLTINDSSPTEMDIDKDR